MGDMNFPQNVLFVYLDENLLKLLKFFKNTRMNYYENTEPDMEMTSKMFST